MHTPSSSLKSSSFTPNPSELRIHLSTSFGVFVTIGFSSPFIMFLHALQEVRLTDILPVRSTRTLGDLLPPLQTRDGVVTRSRQIFALLVYRDLHGHVLTQAFLLFVVPGALLFRHC